MSRDLFSTSDQSLDATAFINNTSSLWDKYFSLDAFSTTSESTEKKNRNFIDSLRNNKEVFLSLLYHSDFEDGESNDAIEYIKDKLSENSIATTSWLCELFSAYQIDSDNPTSSSFVAYGIMRILAYVNNEDCFGYIKGQLIQLLNSALTTNVSYIQEAAIMVIENWRDKDLITLLQQAVIKDTCLSSYRDSVLEELNESVNVVSEVV